VAGRAAGGRARRRRAGVVRRRGRRLRPRAAGCDGAGAGLRRGYYTFLYHSELALGEGINEDLSSVGFEQAIGRDEVYAGPYQPYLVHLPGPVTEPAPTILFLHGREGTHLQGQDVLRPAGAILVSAFGRGPTVGYGGTDIFGFVGDLTVYGEQDVVDVLDDVSARLPVDADRVLASGFSMGAVGAFHIAEFYPDRFTAVLPIGGGDYGIGVNRMRPGLLPNLSGMPLRMANGGLDPLASAPGVEEILLTLDTIGTIDYRAFLALERAHELYRPMVDCLFDRLVAEPRVVDPPRVVYAVNPAFEISDPATGLDVRHDRAYWVSGLTLRDPSDRNPTVRGQEVDHSRNASIDVTSLARPERVVSATPVTAVDESYTKGPTSAGRTRRPGRTTRGA
jgi:pimeloyl-ACP methyl ester carboxylesterase